MEIYSLVDLLKIHSLWWVARRLLNFKRSWAEKVVDHLPQLSFLFWFNEKVINQDQIAEENKQK